MDPFSRGIAGDIVEVRRSGGELHLDWRIPGFLDLSREYGDFYESPRFGFHDARWHLTVWPNRCSFAEVTLSLCRDDDDGGPPTRRVIFSVGVRGSGGGVEKRKEENEWPFEKGVGCYSFLICSRSELREQEERLMEDGALTFVCQVKVPGTAATGASFSPDVPIQTDTQTREPNARTCKCQSRDKKGQHQSSDECDICCEAPVDCALNPCGHMMWCHRCALRFREADSPRCPMCRIPIQTILKLYKK